MSSRGQTRGLVLTQQALTHFTNGVSHHPALAPVLISSLLSPGLSSSSSELPAVQRKHPCDLQNYDFFIFICTHQNGSVCSYRVHLHPNPHQVSSSGLLSEVEITERTHSPALMVYILIPNGCSQVSCSLTPLYSCGRRPEGGGSSAAAPGVPVVILANSA